MAFEQSETRLAPDQPRAVIGAALPAPECDRDEVARADPNPPAIPIGPSFITCEGLAQNGARSIQATPKAACFEGAAPWRETTATRHDLGWTDGGNVRMDFQWGRW